MEKKQWNKNIEKVAQEIGDSSKGYKLMHLYQARKHNICYNFLSITSIILGPLAGLLSGIEVALYPNENPTLPILVTVFSSITGILAAALKFGKYDEMSNSNKTAAARYTSIESNVRRQLSLKKNNRISATEYLNWLETKYEDLQLSAPLIHPKIYKEYTKSAKEQNLPIPDNYETIVHIKNKEISNPISININAEPKIVKRNNTMGHLIDFNKFSDKELEYEMKRFIGFT